MQICDSCGRIVEFLQDTSIYIGLKNGDWAAVNAELCPRCKKKLHEMEVEARDHAVLKSHKDFMEGMRGYEVLRNRPITRYSSL
jgi:hypothetical protein